VGRRTKLTPECQAAIIAALRVGAPIYVAAMHGGIGKSAFNNWMERGRKGDEKYAEFLAAIEKAQADAIIHKLSKIHRASDDEWTAAAWWLERKYPEEFGRRDRLAMEGVRGGEPIVFKWQNE
jgi:transposase